MEFDGRLFQITGAGIYTSEWSDITRHIFDVLYEKPSFVKNIR